MKVLIENGTQLVILGYEVFDQVFTSEEVAEQIKEEHGNPATRINQKFVLVEGLPVGDVLEPGEYKAFNTISELTEEILGQ